MQDIKFEVNLDALSEIIGAAMGVTEAVDESTYLSGLIEAAHYAASIEFDQAAAATASGGRLTHMFEYGVPGITRGPARFPDPTSESARLWMHTMTGFGQDKEISFAFRPALAPNPRPTTRDTGVPSRYLRKLSRRKYVFREKAIITELGETVRLRPKNGNLLFVPFYGDESDNPTNTKGFMMYPYAPNNKPIEVMPGRSQAGSFTKFWTGWWAARGERSMSESMEAAVNADFQEAMKLAAAKANSTIVKPPSENDIIGSGARAMKEVKSVMIKKSATRNRRRRK